MLMQDDTSAFQQNRVQIDEPVYEKITTAVREMKAPGGAIASTHII